MVSDHCEIAEVDKDGLAGGRKMEDPTMMCANETRCARTEKSLKRHIRYSPDAS